MLRLGDDQWKWIQEHFPEEHLSDSRSGRKPDATRVVLVAVFWILNTGAQWHLLPQCYLNYKTVHRWVQPDVNGRCHETSLPSWPMHAGDSTRTPDQRSCLYQCRPQ